MRAENPNLPVGETETRTCMRALARVSDLRVINFVRSDFADNRFRVASLAGGRDKFRAFGRPFDDECATCARVYVCVYLFVCLFVACGSRADLSRTLTDLFTCFAAFFSLLSALLSLSSLLLPLLLFLFSLG